MPIPDLPRGASHRRIHQVMVRRVLARLKRDRRDPFREPDAGGVPVEPDKPNTLSGGAAAPLEYDD